ncbi:MAG: rhamnosyltransferase [Pseudohongiellaceae bacterium]
MVVPTLNGGRRFEQCLAALAAQRPAIDALVVIDSGSSDGSAQLAQRFGAQLLTLGDTPFDHGLTRNQGAAALPDVDVIVFLVQDAVPEGDDCLELLAQGALATGVGAATARQLAPRNASPLTRATVARSPMASTKARSTGPLSVGDVAAMTPRQWRSVLLLDNIACAVRGTLFRQEGFRQAAFGEDALLAFDLLCSGWALAHEPRATVRHGHEYDPALAGERYEIDARFFRERFGLAVRPGLLQLAKGFAAQVLADRRWLVANGEWGEPGLLKSSARLRWAQSVAQWRGSRGPLGSLPSRCALPRPEELAA